MTWAGWIGGALLALPFVDVAWRVAVAARRGRRLEDLHASGVVTLRAPRWHERRRFRAASAIPPGSIVYLDENEELVAGPPGPSSYFVGVMGQDGNVEIG